MNKQEYEYWSQLTVSKALESVYSDQKNFVYEYTFKPYNVFKKIVKNLKVVPYDLKSLLKDFYNELNVPTDGGNGGNDRSYA